MTYLHALLSRRGMPWLFLAVHAPVAIALFHKVRFDDAFIIFRYAQNLVEGNGLSFNVGETVWGSTSVAWTFVAAAVYWLVGHAATPSVMAALGCLAWSTQAVLLFLLLLTTGQHLLGARAALAIALGSAGSFCWVSMETHLALALGLGAMLAAFQARWKTAATLSALAILARPDAIVPALLVATLAFRSLGLRALRHAALGVAILLPWYAFQFRYFQSAMASSMTSKVGLSSFSHYLLHIATIVPAELLAMVTGWSAPLVAIYAIPVVWPLVGYGAFSLVRKDERLAVLPLWLIAHLGGYLLWRPLTNQTWHMYPAIVLSVVFVWAALVELRENARGMTIVRRVGIPLFAMTLSSLALLRTAWFATTGADTVFWFGGRHRAYVDAANVIRERSRPGDEIAAGEVGTLAYYTGLPVHDWNGLVTANHRELVRALAEGRPGRVRWMAAWAREDLDYFRATVSHRDGLVWRIPGSVRSVYLIDVASKAGPEPTTARGQES